MSVTQELCNIYLEYLPLLKIHQLFKPTSDYLKALMYQLFAYTVFQSRNSFSHRRMSKLDGKNSRVGLTFIWAIIMKALTCFSSK